MQLRLSDIRLRKLSDIASDIAVVALASVALPAVLEPDTFNLMAATSGFMLSLLFWSFSLWLLKEI